MGKCEWKDGKYKKGDKVKVWSLQSFMGGGFLKGAEAVVYQDQLGDSVLISVERNMKGEVKIDPHYEVYAEQLQLIPEPEKPLIVKSGGTFVTEHEEINYLWTEQESPEDIGSIDYDGKWKVHSGWKSFSEIEKEGLTDKIAKLRPMVNGSDYDKNVKSRQWIQMLVYVYPIKQKEYNRYKTLYDTWEYCRLATPHELQEAK